MNGVKTNLNMKLSSSGDAYFVHNRKRVSNQNEIITVEKKDDKTNMCENEVKTKNAEIGINSKNKLNVEIDVEESIESPRKDGISAPTTPIELGKKLQKFQIDKESKKKFIIFLLSFT